MTKADAIKLLLDVELQKTPPAHVPQVLGILARLLRELLEGKFTEDDSPEDED